MLSFEMWDSGFVLTVEGRRMLRHSVRRPCAYLGCTPEKAKRQGALEWKPLRAFRLVNRGPDRTVIRFEDRFVIDFTYESKVLRMRFEYPSAGAPGAPGARESAGLELRFGADPAERVYGGGVREGPIRLDRPRASLLPRPLARPFPVPSFMTDRGMWLEVFTAGLASADFSGGRWTLRTEGLPDALSIGFGTPSRAGAQMGAHTGTGAGSAMERSLEFMSRESGPRMAPPSWIFSGAALDFPAGTGSEAVQEAVDHAIRQGIRVSAAFSDTPFPAPGGAIACILKAPRFPDEGILAQGMAFAPGALRQAGVAGLEFLSSSSPPASSDGKASPTPCLPPCADASKAAMLGLFASLQGTDRESPFLLCGDPGLADARARGFIAAIESIGAACAAPRGTMMPARTAGVLPAALVPGLLSHSLSGSGFSHVPTGSFPASPEGLESWLRNLEIAAFGPLMKIGMPSPDNRMAMPELMGRIARASEHHVLLEAYHRECARVWLSEGLPPFRHPGLDDPEAHALWKMDDQYLYGKDLLLAPAKALRRRARSLVLPGGSWVHLWSGRLFREGQVTIDAPPGRPAVFYRGESPFASLFESLRRQAVHA